MTRHFATRTLELDLDLAVAVQKGVSQSTFYPCYVTPNGPQNEKKRKK